MHGFSNQIQLCRKDAKHNCINVCCLRSSHIIIILPWTSKSSASNTKHAALLRQTRRRCARLRRGEVHNHFGWNAAPKALARGSWRCVDRERRCEDVCRYRQRWGCVGSGRAGAAARPPSVACILSSLCRLFYRRGGSATSNEAGGSDFYML